MVNREDNMRIVDNAVKLFLSQSDGKGGPNMDLLPQRGKTRRIFARKNANIRL